MRTNSNKGGLQWEKKLLVPAAKNDPNEVTTSVHPPKQLNVQASHTTLNVFSGYRRFGPDPGQQIMLVAMGQNGQGSQPIHLGDRCTCWRYADIIALTKGWNDACTLKNFLKPIYTNIPGELMQYRQWVNWRAETTCGTIPPR